MARKIAMMALVMCIAGSAFAFSVPVGHIELKLVDQTHLYHEDGRPVDFFETVNGTPNYYQDPNNWMGLELRGIFELHSASVVDDSTGVRTQFWSKASSPFEEVTGILSDLVVVSTIQGPSGILVDYAPKYAPVAYTDEDGPPAVPQPPAGGRVTLYVDTTPDYNIDPDSNNSPDDWVTSSYDGDTTKRLEYPSVTALDVNGSPDAGVSLLVDTILPELNDFLGPVTVPGYPTIPAPADGVVCRAVMGFNSGTAEFFLNSVRDGDTNPFGTLSDAQLHTLLTQGSVAPDWAGQQSQWSDFANAQFGDAHMLTNLIWSNSDPNVFQGWYFQSQDPVDFMNVPEPTTMALLGLGILGVVRRRRRK